jgi:hypothetical protein
MIADQKTIHRRGRNCHIRIVLQARATVPNDYRHDHNEPYNLGNTIPVCFWYFPDLSL